jgi:hypothetical protein
VSSVYNPGRAELLVRLGVEGYRIAEIRAQIADEMSEKMREVRTVPPELGGAVNEATDWISDLETRERLNS